MENSTTATRYIPSITYIILPFLQLILTLRQSPFSHTSVWASRFRPCPSNIIITDVLMDHTPCKLSLLNRAFHTTFYVFHRLPPERQRGCLDIHTPIWFTIPCHTLTCAWLLETTSPVVGDAPAVACTSSPILFRIVLKTTPFLSLTPFFSDLTEKMASTLFCAIRTSIRVKSDTIRPSTSLLRALSPNTIPLIKKVSGQTFHTTKQFVIPSMIFYKAISVSVPILDARTLPSFFSFPLFFEASLFKDIL